MVARGRRKVERHNEEFIALWKESGLTQRDIAQMIGVGLTTVKSWCVDENTVMAATCPKWRVDVFKIALGKKLTGLTDRQRQEVLEIFRSIN
jgi:DNA-binding XRE family transcriptional regulator